MFELKWTEPAEKQYEHIKAMAVNVGRSKARKSTKSVKSQGLLKQVIKTLRHLKSDPRHQGLNSHVFSSLKHPFNSNGKVFESYIQNNTPGAYRVFWCYGPNSQQITVIAITPHP